jgi:hypothetical protein
MNYRWSRDDLQARLVAHALVAGLVWLLISQTTRSRLTPFVSAGASIVLHEALDAPLAAQLAEFGA